MPKRLTPYEDNFEDAQIYIRQARSQAAGLGHQLLKFRATRANPRKFVSYCKACGALVIVHPDAYTAPVGKAVAEPCAHPKEVV